MALSRMATMSISARLVSWPEFEAALQAHRTQPDFLFRAEDAQEPWVQYASLCTDSPTTAMFASDVYEELRHHLSSDARTKLDQLFGVFFWWNKADDRYTPTYFQDVSDVPDSEAFAITMKPATVKKHLELWDQAAFDWLRQPFDEEFPTGVERVQSFDEFKQYVEMWIGLLRKAAQQDRGLVVSVFGT
jgi:hypothetical protein